MPSTHSQRCVVTPWLRSIGISCLRDTRLRAWCSNAPVRIWFVRRLSCASTEGIVSDGTPWARLGSTAVTGVAPGMQDAFRAEGYLGDNPRNSLFSFPLHRRTVHFPAYWKGPQQDLRDGALFRIVPSHTARVFRSHIALGTGRYRGTPAWFTRQDRIAPKRRHLFAEDVVRPSCDGNRGGGAVSCVACPVCSCMVAETVPGVELGGGGLRSSGC